MRLYCSVKMLEVSWQSQRAKIRQEKSNNDEDDINTIGVQVDMLAGLAQLEFDILGLDSWWIGLTDQGHEGRYS